MARSTTPKLTVAEQVDALLNEAQVAKLNIKQTDETSAADVTNAKWSRVSAQVDAQVSLGAKVNGLRLLAGDPDASGKRVYELVALAADVDGASVISRGSKRAAETLGSTTMATKALQYRDLHTAERFAQYRGIKDHRPNATWYHTWLMVMFGGRSVDAAGTKAYTVSMVDGVAVLKGVTRAAGTGGSTKDYPEAVRDLFAMKREDLQAVVVADGAPDVSVYTAETLSLIGRTVVAKLLLDALTAADAAAPKQGADALAAMASGAK